MRGSLTGVLASSLDDVRPRAAHAPASRRRCDMCSPTRPVGRAAQARSAGEQRGARRLGHMRDVPCCHTGHHEAETRQVHTRAAYWPLRRGNYRYSTRTSAALWASCWRSGVDGRESLADEPHATSQPRVHSRGSALPSVSVLELRSLAARATATSIRASRACAIGHHCRVTGEARVARAQARAAFASAPRTAPTSPALLADDTPRWLIFQLATGPGAAEQTPILAAKPSTAAVRPPSLHCWHQQCRLRVSRAS